ADATNAPVDLTVAQNADGSRTRAGMELTQLSGSDITAVATASSNNITVTNDSHPASVTSDQFNGNSTEAEVTLAVGSWSGTVTASSYGVANSAIASNSGPMTTANGTQTS